MYNREVGKVAYLLIAAVSISAALILFFLKVEKDGWSDLKLEVNDPDVGSGSRPERRDLNLATILIADTPEERARGLGGLEKLREGEAMLFVFDEPAYHSIWMKDMNFSIDIIWLDENYRVVDIKERVAPETYPKIFTPRDEASYVLETKAGLVPEEGIKAGDILGGGLHGKEVVGH
ncbi:MAG: DUF192 domain-containing protein [Candidatus Taylorbacteria bacterium]|nr:DUF192 domain-containing protein [Candidatus Taylorbacteria bacterium]